jgi:hypothetical protein
MSSRNSWRFIGSVLLGPAHTGIVGRGFRLIPEHVDDSQAKDEAHPGPALLRLLISLTAITKLHTSYLPSLESRQKLKGKGRRQS